MFWMKSNEAFIIKGLDGKKTLKGKVSINGAKNAVLKAMSASVLFNGPIVLENVPNTEDVKTMQKILEKLGAKISWLENSDAGGRLQIDPSQIHTTDIDVEMAQSMRASVVLTGPILSRFGKVSFPAPGGCVIGSRPIDLFVKAYEKMGAKTVVGKDSYNIVTNNKESLKGETIFFDIQTVGGTETLMMAAVLANGKTVLKNCAMEPEIVSVAEWLNSCGANIVGAGTTTIEINGTSGKLLSAKHIYKTIPDRIEAGSFIILGAVCGEDIYIERCEPKHMEALVNLLKDSGVNIGIGKDYVRVQNNKDSNSFKAFNVRTHEYPGFPTDLQAQIVTMLTQAQGESIVFETIFEGRFKYTEDLQKMGANITVMNPREVIIKGKTDLKLVHENEELRAHDIRAGFAIVVAALLSKGQSKITNIHLIDRGYEKLENRLTNIGAEIKRISS